MSGQERIGLVPQQNNLKKQTELEDIDRMGYCRVLTSSGPL